MNSASKGAASAVPSAFSRYSVPLLNCYRTCCYLRPIIITIDLIFTLVATCFLSISSSPTSLKDRRRAKACNLRESAWFCVTCPSQISGCPASVSYTAQSHFDDASGLSPGPGLAASLLGRSRSSQSPGHGSSGFCWNAPLFYKVANWSWACYYFALLIIIWTINACINILFNLF